MDLITDIYFDNAFYTPPGEIQLPVKILDASGNEVGSFPVQVFDENMNPVGYANNKQEYMDMWNLYNGDAGRLVGDYNPFAFVLIEKRQLGIDTANGVTIENQLLTVDNFHLTIS